MNGLFFDCHVGNSQVFYGRFSLNLVIQVLFFAVFYGQKSNIQELVLPQIRISCNFSQATLHFELFDV